MKIAVCVSHVPDTATRVKITSDQKSIDPSGVSFVLNPYDEYAVEEALKTKEKFGGEVVVLSVGSDKVKETIRKSLAMGVDEAIHLKTDEALDSFAVAQALADEIKLLGSELVFMGKQSVDYDNGIIGQIVAELLGFNSISVCVTFQLEGDKVTAEREIEGGKEVVETSLPCVITAQKGLNEPRYASLKGIMTAKKKVIQEKPVGSKSALVENIQLRMPTPKNPGRILGTDSSAVPELVKLLHEEAKVI
ncbi:MAG: electron transfer flavoprotein subunit beta [Ignavibacteria bacterium CG_4_8_14_3_um_filter_37_9]|nr:MAG: electron transfer flavoprotein subunit beta [Ignavibacteria bacterium CG_4_8_14_3_um_filter_37_9]PIX94084.1 MAG: electron transfer flavoprotein subunit beta [Ignavibacteria bacterium CG_4_10_14_3_um_filter_37_18]